MNATVHIQTALRGQTTYLKNVFCTPPFKVADITEHKHGPLQLMLMSASPGILDKDEYRLTVDVAAGTSLQLHTQSYQRIFNMKQGAAQHMEVYLHAGASFCFLPHPAVPHTNACFTARNNIHCAAGSRLLWGEVLTCGRKGNGEVFRFARYHSLTNVFVQGRLAIRENMLLVPSETDVMAMGMLEGFTHQASLIYIDAATIPGELHGNIEMYLSQQTGIVYGITAAPVQGYIVRLLGHHAEQLFDCLKAVAAICSPTLTHMAYAH
jgi:urease accessory protein